MLMIFAGKLDKKLSINIAEYPIYKASHKYNPKIS